MAQVEFNKQNAILLSQNGILLSHFGVFRTSNQLLVSQTPVCLLISVFSALQISF